MLQNNLLRAILLFIFGGSIYLASVSARADIIDTPEHRQAERTVAAIPNVRQKIITTFDAQSTASCMDIIVRTIGLEMSPTSAPMSSAQKYEAALFYEIVGLAYTYYGEGVISTYFPFYERETDLNRIAARARVCFRLTKSIL